MCGRFTLHTPLPKIAEFIGLDYAQHGTMNPRYNIAPGQPIVNVSRRLGSPGFESYWWGLKPRWAKADFKPAPINARAETVASSGMFRAAFREHRSVIPADGFYEWRREGGQKRPYYIRRKDGAPLLFAGLYEEWGKGEEQRTTCAIITGEPNDTVRPIHDRMPVILPRKAALLWMDPDLELEKAQALLRPAPADLLEVWPVTTAVNKPTNDGPELLGQAG